jgi:hypothetical protein
MPTQSSPAPASLAQRLETSLAVVRGLTPDERDAAIARARRHAHSVTLAQRALAERDLGRRMVRHLVSIGRIAREARFTITLRELARLAREHRSRATLASMELRLVVRELRGGL